MSIVKHGKKSQKDVTTQVCISQQQQIGGENPWYFNNEKVLLSLSDFLSLTRKQRFF